MHLMFPFHFQWRVMCIISVRFLWRSLVSAPPCLFTEIGAIDIFGSIESSAPPARDFQHHSDDIITAEQSEPFSYIGLPDPPFRNDDHTDLDYGISVISVVAARHGAAVF